MAVPDHAASEQNLVDVANQPVEVGIGYDDAGTGVVMVGEDDEELDSLDPPWPAWSERIDELESELDERAVATA